MTTTDNPPLCQVCARKPGETNHPPGMIFIGWGRGWETCSTCDGTTIAPAPKSVAPAVTSPDLATLIDAARAALHRQGATLWPSVEADITAALDAANARVRELEARVATLNQRIEDAEVDRDNAIDERGES